MDNFLLLEYSSLQFPLILLDLSPAAREIIPRAGYMFHMREALSSVPSTESSASMGSGIHESPKSNSENLMEVAPKHCQCDHQTEVGRKT